MKLYIPALLAILCTACNNPDTGNSNNLRKDTILINLDTVPEIRKIISLKPVAAYHEKIEDALNDWSFDIKVYETSQTFRFLVKIKYEELTATDTLKIPNMGIQPVIELRQGKGKYVCIAGFYDKQKVYREYKKISINNGSLSIKTIGHYGVYNVLK
jgi:hypothetical protein